MGQQEYRRHEGRIHDAVNGEDALWQDKYAVIVIADDGSDRKTRPHVYVTLRSGSLNVTLPRLKPRDARHLAELVLAAADDAESVVAQAA